MAAVAPAVVRIGRGGGLAHTTAEDWDLTFAVNLRGHFLVARAAAPHMAEGGAFVFVSSLAGLQPGSRLPAYDASKAGLLGLSRHVALEGARRGVEGGHERGQVLAGLEGPQSEDVALAPGPGPAGAFWSGRHVVRLQRRCQS